MSEIKLEVPTHRKLVVDFDQQDFETLDTLNTEPKVSIYLEADDAQDSLLPDAKGNITRVRTVNLNGIQWNIPVQVQASIPQSIFNIIEQSRAALSRPRIQPNKSVFLGSY